MPKFSWIIGLIVGSLLVGFTAIAQDPTTKRPPRELEARVQSLEEAFVEQTAKVRNLTIAVNDLIEQRGPMGLQPGPETKGKFDSPVRIISLSSDYDLLRLDNGLVFEVAKESIRDVTSSFKGQTIEVFYTGPGPYPYRAMVNRGESLNPYSVRGRLLGKL